MSCDRPTRSSFSVVFLGPRANAELVPKFHVALHASHAALPMLTPKFRPKVAPHINIKIPPNGAVPQTYNRIQNHARVQHDLAQHLFSLHSSSYRLHLQKSQPHLSSPYQKDERALPGDLRSRNLNLNSDVTHPIKCSVYIRL
jgi:hypothetical protein